MHYTIYKYTNPIPSLPTSSFRPKRPSINCAGCSRHNAVSSFGFLHRLHSVGPVFFHCDPPDASHSSYHRYTGTAPPARGGATPAESAVCGRGGTAQAQASGRSRGEAGAGPGWWGCVGSEGEVGGPSALRGKERGHPAAASPRGSDQIRTVRHGPDPGREGGGAAAAEVVEAAMERQR